jgi:hypothetical protein
MWGLIIETESLENRIIYTVLEELIEIIYYLEHLLYISADIHGMWHFGKIAVSQPI